jgi:hypothetical protein
MLESQSMTTKTILASADETPLGAVILSKNDPLTIRYPDGRGWHLLSTACATTRKGWLWREHDITGPVQVLAEGLSDDECHALSGMSAAEAVLWCERRASHTKIPTEEAERLFKLSDAALHASGGTVTTGAELSAFIAAQDREIHELRATNLRRVGQIDLLAAIVDGNRRRAFFKDLDHAEVIRPMRRDFFRALDDAESKRSSMLVCVAAAARPRVEVAPLARANSRSK